MSELRIISPLLDGFTLGTPISEHHGVMCCPAVKENTNKKFIVKIISVPATQVQFDAMLVAGVYKDPGDAMEYFRGQGETILKEAETLKMLSKLEGFLPYEGWQMEPITRRRLGYEIYLVGSYKRSLDKYMRKNPLTHLEAVNLGLDLCSALSVCRQSGYLYIDLKPSNIFVSEKKEFRIGDLGFLSLDTLRYASLPERCFGPYTPPELLDPMTVMNLTVDTYAVGMILYQLYNDGQLPSVRDLSLENVPNPCHADYEMAEIIMKAIHPDPEQRWTDPKEMGKAIAAYMQRNTINDIPITPFIPLDVKQEDIVTLSDDHEPEYPPENQDTELEDSSEETIPETVSQDVQPDAECSTEEITESDNGEETLLVSEADSDANGMDLPQIDDHDIDEARNVEQQEDDPEIAPKVENDSEIHSENEDNVSFGDISEEVAKIITKADDIIAHEIPEEITFPVEEEADPFAFAREDSDELDNDLAFAPVMEEDSELPNIKKKNTKHFENTARKKKIRKFISRCFMTLLLSGAAVGGFWYYQNIYLQKIDSLTVSGTQDQITVLVDTSVEESKLLVHCISENGKRRSESVEGGKVIFSDLSPSTQYTIEVDMSGFHKLTGAVTEVFTTEATRRVVSFQAVAGSEDGSAILTFDVDGGDPDFWNIHYTAEGEEEQLETVTGHSAMITGLTMGKTYTFTLDGGNNFDLSGELTTQFLASRLVLAENLRITSSDGSEITIHWDTPGDVVVESWDIRCYDGYGYEEQTTVTENYVQFMNLDPGSHYTVEVTAAGMTHPSKINISMDPIHISDFQIEESKHTEMEVSWEHTGETPEGGWILSYTIDGSGMQSVPCAKASAVIAPLVPDANYKFVLQAADERTLVNNAVQYRSNEAEAYTENNFDAQNVTINLLRTPEEAGWSVETIDADAFTNTFSVGDSASMALQSTSAVYVPSNKTKILFVFRDSYGNALPELVSEVSCIWKSIWTKGDVKTGEIDIPVLPDKTGEYLLDVYFNGRSAAQLEIKIVE